MLNINKKYYNKEGSHNNPILIDFNNKKILGKEDNPILIGFENNNDKETISLISDEEMNSEFEFEECDDNFEELPANLLNMEKEITTLLIDNENTNVTCNTSSTNSVSNISISSNQNIETNVSIQVSTPNISKSNIKINIKSNSNLKIPDIRNKNLWKIISDSNRPLGNKYYFNNEPYFEVRKSNIKGAGYGLFSLKEFKLPKKRKSSNIVKKIIFYYEGKVIAFRKNNKWNYDEFKKIKNIDKNIKINVDDFNRWQASPEGYCIMDIYDKNILNIIDGRFCNFNGTRYINDSKGKNKGNLRLIKTGGFNIIKNINVGDELLFQYSFGNTYWKNRNNDIIEFKNKSIKKRKKNQVNSKSVIKNKIKCFPSIPITGYTISNRFEKNRLVESLWKGGRDPNYKKKYDGYIKSVNHNNNTCKILFDDGCYDNVNFSDITLIKRFCQHCGEFQFINKKNYLKHVKKCKNK